jgi:iron complex outermembrane receptor protein
MRCSFGGEWRNVNGTSDELQYAINGKVTHVENGGVQRIGGAFVEDVIAASSRLGITAALRVDSWRDHETATSPRLSMLYRVSNELSLTASAYRAFRAPTLNELYRGFRVGNVQTLANAELTPEHLEAVELGARWRWLRATLFSMSIDDTIANVTLSSTPSLITRRRQNAGTSRSRGAELEGEWRLPHDMRVSAGYLLCRNRCFRIARLVHGRRGEHFQSPRRSGSDAGDHPGAATSSSFRGEVPPELDFVLT